MWPGRRRLESGKMAQCRGGVSRGSRQRCRSKEAARAKLPTGTAAQGWAPYPEHWCPGCLQRPALGWGRHSTDSARGAKGTGEARSGEAGGVA